MFPPCSRDLTILTVAQLSTGLDSGDINVDELTEDQQMAIFEYQSNATAPTPPLASTEPAARLPL